MSDARLTFVGAAGTVTGSRFWLREGDRSWLFDCGVFQGDDELEQRDWRPQPFSARELDAIVLTHAHIDHSGFLPRLVREGYRGPVYATKGTCDLLTTLLPDSAHLQEEQAEYANRKAYARHLPAKPLYTSEDAREALRLLRPVPFAVPFHVDDGLTLVFRPAGHILGSASVEARLRERVVGFSGDLGRASAFMRAPASMPHADHLLLESTYGDRRHPRDAPERTLERLVRRIDRDRSALLVPSFAVGRAQHLLLLLRHLVDQGRIPRVPVVLDSPMAVDATETYCANGDDPNLAVELRVDPHECPLHFPGLRFTHGPDESRRLNDVRGPIVIISANGMCTGGRVRHHLRQRLPHDTDIVLLVGYQAPGTLGSILQRGAKQVRIHGREIPVNAEIVTEPGLSAHADQDDLLAWLDGFHEPPRDIHVVHGEPEASAALAGEIQRRFGRRPHLPKLGEEIRLA